MIDTTLIYILAIFSIAGFIHGVVGFAFALIATPLLSLILPIKEAILLTIVPTIWANIFTTFNIKKGKRILFEYKGFFISIIVGSFLGTKLLFIIPPIAFMLFLIAMIWIYLYIDFKKDSIKLCLDAPYYKYIIGLLAGISVGITNVMSPILLVYFLSTNKKQNEIIILSNFAFFLSKLTQLSIFITHQFISKEYLIATTLIVFCVTIALYLGKKVREYSIITTHYNHIVKIFIFIISLLLLSRVIKYFYT